MNADSLNPLSIEQVEVDLFLANAAIQKAEELSSGKGKYYRGQAGYHLQQAAEKMIKLQIYDSNAEINNAKMYRHSLDDLITYAALLGVTINIPKWIDEKKYTITEWEAQGRYDIHFVVRMDTLKRAYKEILQWKEIIQKSR